MYRGKPKNYSFTSESVSEGHPDKIADLISDSIADAFYTKNIENGTVETTRIACETMTATNLVVLAGEFRSPAGHIHYEEIARNVVKKIGYEQDGFHYDTFKFYNNLHKQSVDIAQGVDQGTGLNKEEGAGDQGIMFGYAVNETPELMPAPIQYAHAILRNIADARHNGALKGIVGPDSKSQLSVRYENYKPVGVESIVLSTQHMDEKLTSEDIANLVRPYIEQTLPDGWISADTVWHINPTGKFVIGGPDGDAGLTGRKIIVDTYGGAARHGGGAFSGKDFTKVDRSAAYMSRYVAKNIVAAELAEECEIQLSYAIGIPEPQSVFVNTFGTGKVDESELAKAVRDVFDLSPRGIRTTLDLMKPIYARTAAYGHFGREPESDGGFSWEKTDQIKNLQTALNL
jgi:S-adenosylmethionine synthetase